MELDKDLYREYYVALKKWSQQEDTQRVLDSRNLTSEQAWNRYIALWELLIQFTPGDRESRHLEHINEVDRYYSIVRKLHDYHLKNGESI
jgi:hypothetical protein